MDFLGFCQIFWIIFGFFLDFFQLFGLFWIYGFVEFFEFFLDFFFWVSFKVNKVTTKCYHGYYWTPKIAQNGPKQHKKLFSCSKCKKKPRPKAKALRRS